MPTGSPPASQAEACCARGLCPSPHLAWWASGAHAHVLMEPLLRAGQGPGGGGGRWTEQSTWGPAVDSQCQGRSGRALATVALLVFGEEERTGQRSGGRDEVTVRLAGGE